MSEIESDAEKSLIADLMNRMTEGGAKEFKPAEEDEQDDPILRMFVQPKFAYTREIGKAIFAQLVQTGGNIRKSCSRLNITRNDYYYYLRQQGPDFDEFRSWVEKGKEYGVDTLIDEVNRRGHEGVDKPIFYQGEECGVIREYSDGLLKYMISIRKPELAERQNVNVTGGLNLTNMDLSKLDENELATLQSILTKLSDTESTESPNSESDSS